MDWGLLNAVAITAMAILGLYALRRGHDKHAGRRSHKPEDY